MDRWSVRRGIPSSEVVAEPDEALHDGQTASVVDRAPLGPLRRGADHGRNKRAATIDAEVMSAPDRSQYPGTKYGCIYVICCQDD